MRHQLWKGIAAGVLLLSHSGIMAEAREAEPLQILEVDMQHMGEPWQNEEWVNDPVVIRVKTNRLEDVQLGCSRSTGPPQQWHGSLCLQEGGDWFLFARDEEGEVSAPLLLQDLRIDGEAPEYGWENLIVERDWKTQTGSFRRDLARDAAQGITSLRMRRSDEAWQEVGEETVYFQGNEIITFQAEDAAGNVSETTLTFCSVDDQAPELDISFAQPQISAVVQQADIVLRDAHPDEKAGYALLEKDGVSQRIDLCWQECADGLMARLHVEGEGSYRLTVIAADRSGNQSEETVSFIIDEHAPIIDHQFAQQRPSCDGPLRLKIRVQEENFCETGVSLLGSYADVPLTWTEEDGWHAAELTLTQDGRYEGKVIVRDMAGNVKEHALPSLVVDTQKPVVRIEGIDERPRAEGVMNAQVTVIEDDPDLQSIDLCIIGSDGHVQTVRPQIISQADGLCLKVSDLDSRLLQDDRYTLRVSVMDQAGNQSEQEAFFRINRFGSLFSMSKGGEEEPLVIQERNVDQIEQVQIVLRMNDELKVLEEGRDYALHHALNAWNEYAYVLDPALFQQDGSYSVSVLSTDAAGNRNRSSAQLPMRFTVDRQPPQIRSLGAEDSGGEKKLKLMITDAFDVRDIRVTVDGDQASWHKQGGVYYVTLPKMTQGAQIHVEAEDINGNAGRLVIDGADIMEEEAGSGWALPVLVTMIALTALAYGAKKARKLLLFSHRF